MVPEFLVLDLSEFVERVAFEAVALEAGHRIAPGERPSEDVV